MTLDTKELLQKIGLSLRRTPAGKGDDVLLYRDWAVLFSMLICLACGAVFFGAYLFFTISANGLTQSEDGGIPVQALSREKLDSAVNQYEQKKAAFNELKKKRPVAPSI